MCENKINNEGSEQINFFIKKIFIAIIILIIVLFAYFKASGLLYDYVQWNSYVDTDIEYADGSTAHFDSNVFNLVNRGDKITVHIDLPKRKKIQSACLCFYVYHSIVNVYFGDETLYSFGEDIDKKGDMIGCVYSRISIPDEAWGKSIDIVMDVRENSAYSKIDEFRMYTESASYKYFLGKEFYGFLLSISGIITAIMAMALFLINGKRNSATRRGMYISLFTFLMCLWVFTSNGINNLISNSNTWGKLEYVSLYLIPIPLLLYMYESEAINKIKRILFITTAVTASFDIISIILSELNILHFCRSLFIFHVIALVDACLLMIVTISRMKYRKTSGRQMLIGVLILLASSIIDVLRFNFLKFLPIFSTNNMPSVLSLGMIFFLMFLVLSYITDIKNEKENAIKMGENIEKLNTFIEKIPTGICVVDLNRNMKIIDANNPFCKFIGHTKEEIGTEDFGDIESALSEAEIKRLENLVKKTFQEKKTTAEIELHATLTDGKGLDLLAKGYIDYSNMTVTAGLFDITERKKIENELKVKEEDYRTAVEASGRYYLNYEVSTRKTTFMFDSEKSLGLPETIGPTFSVLKGKNIIAEESIEELKAALENIENGVKSGEITIRLMHFEKNQYRWFGGSYKTIFDKDGKPIHAIVSLDDVTDYREKEIAFNMHRQSINAMNPEKTAYYEFNLSQDICEYVYGNRVERGPVGKWNEMVSYTSKHLVYRSDCKKVTRFLNKEHLLDIYSKGNVDVSLEYRGVTSDGKLQWTKVSVNLVSDTYSGDIKVFCLFEDIDDEKSKVLQRKLEIEKANFYQNAYEKLSSSVLYGICKYKNDEKRSLIFANDIFYRMHGFESKEKADKAGFINLSYIINNSADLKNITDFGNMKKDNEKHYEVEYSYTDINGDNVWLLCRIEYSEDENLFSASMIDISERKKMEEQLRISEDSYKLALTQSGRVFFFFNVDKRTMYLSDELANKFGLPAVVDNMPENLISKNLVEEESIDNYRNFYAEIYSGKPFGNTIISCHTAHNPDVALWYRISFTSVFDDANRPVSSIIIYEDLTEQHEKEIAYKRMEKFAKEIPDEKHISYICNLTKWVLESEEGSAIEHIMDKIKLDLDSFMSYSIEHFIYKDDIEKFAEFVNPERIIEFFNGGGTKCSLIVRGVVDTPIWFEIRIQLLTDPYSGDLKEFIICENIDEKYRNQLQSKMDMEALKEELENSRIKIMINQMQPHFLYNALSAIRTITKCDPNYAYDLLYDFTTHLRSSIKALSSDNPIPFSDELNNIRAYLNIEKMRFGDALKVIYEIDCDTFMVVPLSIQPLAENAARHGVYPKGEEGGTVTVRSYETFTEYVVEVEDDGAGFDVNQIMNKNSDSVGLKNLIFRLKSLMNAEVKIDSKIGQGTLATVIIPKEGGDA